MKPLWRAWCVFYYTWARDSMSHLHPDLPHVVRKLNELNSERTT